MKNIYIILLVFSLVSCASHETIKSVAKIGKSLVDYKDSNVQFASLCDELNQIDPKNDLNCQNIKLRISALNKGIDVLVSYSNTLLLAISDDEFKLSDLVEQTVEAGNAAEFITANDDEISGLKTISDGIQSILTSKKKNKAIRDAIKSTSTSIDGVCDQLISLVNLQKQAYETYRTGLDTRLNSANAERKQLFNGLDLGPSIDQDTRLGGYRYINTEINKLDKMAKAIAAFKLGHNTLLINSNKIGTRKDSEALNQFIKSLNDLFSGIDEFKQN